MKHLQNSLRADEPVYSLATSESPSAAEICELPKTVLVVDDDPDVRELETHVLHVQGYKVLAAECAAEALRLAGETDARRDAAVDLGPGQAMREPGLVLPVQRAVAANARTADPQDASGVGIGDRVVLQPLPERPIRRTSELLDTHERAACTLLWRCAKYMRSGPQGPNLVIRSSSMRCLAVRSG